MGLSFCLFFHPVELPSLRDAEPLRIPWVFIPGRQILRFVWFSDPGAGSGPVHVCVVKDQNRQNKGRNMCWGKLVQTERFREVKPRFRHTSPFLALSVGLAFGLLCNFYASSLFFHLFDASLGRTPTRYGHDLHQGQETKQC